MVVVILLLIPVARAANVEIGRPHIVFLSETAAAIACKSASRRACTTVSTEFVCACARAGDEWTVRPRLIATPFVYATSQTILKHEMEHVSDIASSLNEYADSLTLHTFSTEETCLSFITSETKLFPHTLKLIQRLTTIKRDGVQFASRPGE